MSSSNNNDANNIPPPTTNDNEDEDKINKYSKNTDGGGHYTIIAIFEGNHVRFARQES
jgi:hypothetical protein